MRFDIRALALTAAIMWGGAILLTGLANLIWAGYGMAFLELAGSIYPGYHPGSGVGSVVSGTLYGVVDGGITGAVFGWVYNAMTTRRPAQPA